MSLKYEFIRKIGEGEHGSVYMVEKKNPYKIIHKSEDNESEQDLYAMKKIPLSKNFFDF